MENSSIRGSDRTVGDNSNALYSIGHSNHQINEFIALLKRHDIEAIADVRSAPYSRYNPQYNKEELLKSLKEESIAYVYLGRELGARRDEAECLRNGKVDFSLVRQLPVFLSGIERLLDGVNKMRVAMMCAEKDPMNCHRNVLISEHLKTASIEIVHILADGALINHNILVNNEAEPTADLFNEKI